MRYSLLLIILFFTIRSSAQDCTKEMLATKPGAWKAGLKGSTSGVQAADLLKERSILADIHKMIAAAYNPIGCQALYSNAFEGSGLPNNKNWLADHFSYNIYILRYLCDQNSTDRSKYNIDISTTTTVNIDANYIADINLYTEELPEDDFRGYLKLKTMPQKKDGFFYLGEEVTGDSQSESKIKKYTWLVTYDDVLPFSYISRKEYLLLTKKRLEKTIKDNGGPSAYYNRFMNNINNYLKRPETDLSKPAICNWNDEERFDGFAEEGAKGSFIAVKPNLAYYHKGLKRYVPQFFVFTYKLTENDPVFENNIAAIKKAVDLNKLRQMLGK